MPQKIMMIAGEASGDLHGGNLARELKTLSPDLRIFGVGGGVMQGAGVEIVHDIADLGVIGIVEVIKSLPRFRALYKQLEDLLAAERPDALILVDYPGFNLRFAKAARRHGVPVIYYISPQVWAWRRSRLASIRQLVDLMLVIFDFEKPLYEKSRVPVEFVGHPLMDLPIPTPEQVRAVKSSLGFAESQPLIALLPGSRAKEIEKHLPTMLAGVKILRQQKPELNFAVSRAPEISPVSMEKIMERAGLQLPVWSGSSRELLAASAVSLCASGTVTLESAVLNSPPVVVYKLAPLSWALGMLLIDINYISLVNIIAGKKIVPELIQYEFSAENVARELRRLLENGGSVRQEMAKVREKLGTSGASLRAAQAVQRFLEQRTSSASR